MELSNYFINEALNKFWNIVKEDSLLDESENKSLNDLLSKSKELIFDKFGIDTNSKDYFIAGSALLYLYPNLRIAFGLSNEIGDLDIVIPDKKYWIKAGLEDEYNNKGIYRPQEDDRIEVFNLWLPAKAGGVYADVSVRSTNEIMKDSINIKGFNFMSIDDIVDYKTKLNREKEKDFVKLMDNYIESDSTDKQKFLTKVVKLIGIKQTKEFLGKL